MPEYILIIRRISFIDDKHQHTRQRKLQYLGGKTMIKKLFLVSMCVLAAVSVSYAGPDMKEGKWEMTTKMEMPGMPMEMPPVTYTQCLTKTDFVPQNAQQDPQTPWLRIAGRVTWSRQSKEEGRVLTGSGERKGVIWASSSCGVTGGGAR